MPELTGPQRLALCSFGTTLVAPKLPMRAKVLRLSFLTRLLMMSHAIGPQRAGTMMHRTPTIPKIPSKRTSNEINAMNHLILSVSRERLEWLLPFMKPLALKMLISVTINGYQTPKSA
jgi:hypothetical protein